jgi:thiamine-phosphate pyrophosphorylase
VRRPPGVSRKAAPDSELTGRLERARLYVITPDRDPDALVDLTQAALRGGADVIQLRQKALSRGRLAELARRLRELTEQSGKLFIVNDHVDIAMLTLADGVHLGPDDLTVESARKFAGDGLLIGASASTPAAATAAVAAGADYIGCGAVFATPLKPQKGAIGPGGVKAVTDSVGVPVFAIGGIDESNLEQLTTVGIHRACVIRAVGDATDPESVTRRLRAMLDR